MELEACRSERLFFSGERQIQRQLQSDFIPVWIFQITHRYQLLTPFSN